MRLTLIGLLTIFAFVNKAESGGECRNRLLAFSCEKYSHYCHTVQHRSTMKKYCPLTCGYCACSDLNYCRRFKRSSCLDAFYGFALRRDCPVMCNSCSSRLNLIAMKDATPVRSCLVNNGGCHGLCYELNRRVQCYCPPGFELGEDGFSCQDENECQVEKDLCSSYNQVCINTRGSFNCLANDCSDYPGLYNKYNSNECCYKETSSTCGIDTTSVRSDLPRIVGGKISHFTAWPWMVQIWIGDDKLCGGTLISDMWVLSAAHCFNNITANSKINLVFGRIKANSTKSEEPHVQWRRSVEVTFHPEYNADYFALRDIVLLRVDQPVIFNKYVNPICLPNGEKPPPGTICWASGYGTTSFGGKLALNLREVDLKIVSKSDCNDEYPHVQSLIDSSTLFCAGSKNGKKDTCQGDSGGPLMCQRCASCSWYLTGITSSGRSCSRTYGLYTDVLRHESWISQVTGIHVGKDKTCRKQHETQWTGWTEWGECSKSCGGGEKVRRRSCWNGEAGHYKCQGPTFERLFCNELPCRDNTKKISGTYEVVLKSTRSQSDYWGSKDWTLEEGSGETHEIPEHLEDVLDFDSLSSNDPIPIIPF